MNKIILIIPFYGAWPKYTDIFLHSCSYNSNLHFLFITDLELSKDIPNNIFIHYMSFKELQSKIEQQLNIKLTDFKPYKLCDFKPAYGFIFNELIMDYNFWGYCDIDLIFGDTKKFLSEELLNSYDIISFKEGILHGPFTLYRNIDKVNKLFKSGDEYKNIFTNPKYLSFDEFGFNEFGSNHFFGRQNLKVPIRDLPSDNISVIAFKSNEEKSTIRIYAKEKIIENLKFDQIIYYNNGKVCDLVKKKEYLFYHWVIEKRAVWFKYPNWFKNKPAKIYISQFGFFLPSHFRFYTLLSNFRCIKGIIYWYYIKISNAIKRRMGIKLTLEVYPKKGWIKRL